jgi:diketogulonate reductase-like aldo/keto reductase
MKLNLDATSLELSEEDMKRIARLDFNGRYIVGGFWVAPEKGYTLENLWDE